MSRSSLSAVSRTTFAVGLLAVMVFAIVMLVVPAAQAATSSNCTYYSDGSHNTVVGQFGRDCCNNAVAWGIKTQFKTCGGCFICFPPPR